MTWRSWPAILKQKSPLRSLSPRPAFFPEINSVSAVQTKEKSPLRGLAATAGNFEAKSPGGRLSALLANFEKRQFPKLLNSRTLLRNRFPLRFGSPFSGAFSQNAHSNLPPYRTRRPQLKLLVTAMNNVHCAHCSEHRTIGKFDQNGLFIKEFCGFILNLLLLPGLRVL